MKVLAIGFADSLAAPRAPAIIAAAVSSTGSAENQKRDDDADGNRGLLASPRLL